MPSASGAQRKDSRKRNGVKMSITIEADKRGLIIQTPFSRLFVDELKRLVPASERQFDGQSKAWIVAPQHGKAVQRLILTVFKEAVGLPAIKATSGRLEKAVIRVEYLGQCKQRADGTVSAYGHDGQGWAYIVPESALKSFFGRDVEIEVDGEKGPSAVKQAPATLYAALLVRQDCSPLDLKAAYRRMARLTHPDVNHEPDAAEQFKQVKRAWDVLSDPAMRKRYDAGLALEASLNQKYKEPAPFGRFGPFGIPDLGQCFFRSPLRCGLLTVDGEHRLGRVVVSRIYDWQDITDEQGRTLVTSWVMGAETYERRWV